MKCRFKGDGQCPVERKQRFTKETPHEAFSARQLPPPRRRRPLCRAGFLSRMVLLVMLLFSLQVLWSWAAPPARAAPAPLLPPRCAGPAVEAAADLALGQINAHRREGYVLSLYRIFSAREHPQEITGSVFYLILDVVDTNCHVLSKKLWKDCETRPTHETAYGQCKAIIYTNQPRNIAHLSTYECVLQRVPRRYIWETCPDCPVDACPTEPKYLEVAAQSLAKYNEESEQTHYFSVLNVTKASMQWVVGPAHFVEFTIQETSCSKSDSATDISKCQPLSSESAKMGFCTGSVVRSDLEQKEFVEISCEIYNPEAPVTEEGEQQPDQRPGKPSQRHQGASSLEANPFTSYLGKTVGWVKVIPPSTENTSCQNVPEREHTDRKPVPSEAVEPKTSLLDIAGNPDGENIQADKHDLTKLVNGPVILPFPEELLPSDTCPGKAKERDPTLDTLLARKPTKE